MLYCMEWRGQVEWINTSLDGGIDGWQAKQVCTWMCVCVCVKGEELNHPGVRQRARLRVFNRQVSPWIDRLESHRPKTWSTQPTLTQTPKQAVGSVNDSRLGCGWMSQCRGYHMPVSSQVWDKIADINVVIIITLPIPIYASICMSVQTIGIRHERNAFTNGVWHLTREGRSSRFCYKKRGAGTQLDPGKTHEVNLG